VKWFRVDGTSFKKKIPRDNKFKTWIRSLLCLECHVEPCGTAHHTETGGMGVKGSDYSCVPLCPKCHDRWHTTEGKRGGFSREEIAQIVERIVKCYPGKLKLS